MSDVAVIISTDKEDMTRQNIATHCDTATYRDIVVVGASAGGIEALQTLVAGLPETFGAAMLVVLHIPAHSPSQLHHILSKPGVLPVKPAENGEPIVLGQIYVATSDRHLIVEEDHIRVTRGPKENRVRPAVDTLFRSVAYRFGSRVIGVVLSGMLDDGTAGLWTIKDHGGTTIVQSPQDALFSSMPESALQHVAVDYTLPVAKMPALLTKLTSETIATNNQIASSKAIELETQIALESNALRGGAMQLGPVSANTCPECHGVLVRIREGKIIRYRCHTGHAYSLQTLLAEVNKEIDATVMGGIASH
ncbi:MAG: chemotaxis protein CheB [Elainellaceae cyanobacterium]